MGYWMRGRRFASREEHEDDRRQIARFEEADAEYGCEGGDENLDEYQASVAGYRRKLKGLVAALDRAIAAAEENVSKKPVHYEREYHGRHPKVHAFRRWGHVIAPLHNHRRALSKLLVERIEEEPDLSEGS